MQFNLIYGMFNEYKASRYLCYDLNIYSIYYNHCNFIRHTLLVSGWTPFAFRTALILHVIDSTRCWKHSSEILVHIVMIASHSSCRFVVCTSMMWISRPTTSHNALLDWDLVTVEAIWVKCTHCHVQETSLRWFELCDVVHYPAGSTSEDGTLWS